MPYLPGKNRLNLLFLVHRGLARTFVPLHASMCPCTWPTRSDLHHIRCTSTTLSRPPERKGWLWSYGYDCVDMNVPGEGSLSRPYHRALALFALAGVGLLYNRPGYCDWRCSGVPVRCHEGLPSCKLQTNVAVGAHRPFLMLLASGPLGPAPKTPWKRSSRNGIRGKLHVFHSMKTNSWPAVLGI